MSLAWRAEHGGKIVSLRNGKGSGNPVGRPYMLLVQDSTGRPLARAWLSNSDLALLLSQLSREMKVRPITDILRGDHRSV